MLDELEGKIRRIIEEKPNRQASDMRDCIDELLSLTASSAQLDLTERLLLGEIVPNTSLTYGEDEAFFDSGWARMVNLLFEHGRLTYDIVKRSIWRAYRNAYCLTRCQASSPFFRRFAWLHELQFRRYISESCAIVLDEYAEKLAWEMALDFSSQARLILDMLYSLTGSRYLLLSAQYHAKFLTGKMKLHMPFPSNEANRVLYSISYTLIHMLHNFTLENLSDAEYQSLVARLQEFPRDTLKAVLPFAHAGQQILCDALDWQDGYPLVEFIMRTALQTFSREDIPFQDIPNSSDPASGIINVAEAKLVLQQAGDEQARAIIQLFRQSGENLGNTLVLVEAVTGWNRSKVEAGMKKHSQISIKAFGLLPLERGEGEVLERYLALKLSAKDGQKFGQMRRISHAAAVQTALSNLAQVAGYADASRLEWAMEARIAESSVSGRVWSIGDYELELAVDGAEANLIVRRNGRSLKSIPKEVRTSEAYLQAKDIVGQLRSQASRIRSGLLEGLIASGDLLSPDQLKQFMRLPAARDMFQRLIWQTEAGLSGLFNAETFAIEDVAANVRPIEAPMRVAHPYFLFQNNILAEWQRRIVHQHIVQPIKQAFRELYILTPAEQATNTYSNRFAGHVVDATIAGRLFGARGWRMEKWGDNVVPYKIFSGLRAVFEFPDVFHFFGGSAPVTADRIYFQPYPGYHDDIWRWQDRGKDWLPLEQIPSIIFSEVMRDADLIVSVAQREGEARLSNEAYDQRGNLVRALLDDLGLPGVEVEGHFAYVQGKLARYRVHLGSAVIHIDPGNYLCIVPDRWGQSHEKLFLPFADENDSKISEVISKILLLLADDKIKDESILRQIRRQQPVN